MHPPLRILSAGSLRDALTAHAATQPGPFDLVFGPAGLLRERIEQGEPCDLFLSASMAHPETLARRTGAAAILFARNPFLAIARKQVGLTPDNFLACLLDPAIRLGTSTPGADPSGDYADAMFDLADRLHQGAAAHLREKALRLVGGRIPAQVPEGSNPIAHFLTNGTADIFLGYRSGARHHADAFDVVLPPPPLRVVADYGMLVSAATPQRRAAADSFAASLLSPAGQAGLAAHGLAPL